MLSATDAVSTLVVGAIGDEEEPSVVVADETMNGDYEKTARGIVPRLYVRRGLGGSYSTLVGAPPTNQLVA